MQRDNKKSLLPFLPVAPSQRMPIVSCYSLARRFVQRCLNLWCGRLPSKMVSGRYGARTLALAGCKGRQNHRRLSPVSFLSIRASAASLLSPGDPTFCDKLKGTSARITQPPRLNRKVCERPFSYSQDPSLSSDSSPLSHLSPLNHYTRFLSFILIV